MAFLTTKELEKLGIPTDFCMNREPTKPVEPSKFITERVQIHSDVLYYEGIISIPEGATEIYMYASYDDYGDTEINYTFYGLDKKIEDPKYEQKYQKYLKAMKKYEQDVNNYKENKKKYNKAIKEKKAKEEKQHYERVKNTYLQLKEKFEKE